MDPRAVEDRRPGSERRRRVRRPLRARLRRGDMSTSTDEVAEATAREPGTRFGRALLKLSGEALLGGREYGIDPKTVSAISEEIVAVQASGTQLAVVVGAGNI